MPSPLASRWSLDPEVTFLNHGSYGAAPRAVLEVQAELRSRMEKEPVRFFQRDLQGLVDDAVARLGAFVGSPVDDIGPVSNATSGVNAVLRSLEFQAGDELVVTDHAYPACRNAVEFVAHRWGARVVVVKLPLASPGAPETADRIIEAVSERTRLVLISHVTSPTAVVIPVAEIVARLDAVGVDTLVDGAHAPGMVPVDVAAIGAAYYAGNCHKWMCAPKGAGFLYVRPDRQDRVVPAVISHGYTGSDNRRSRHRQLFDWVGTDDPTALLSVPAAIDALAAMVPGGWDEVRARNHTLVLAGRAAVADELAGLLREPLPPDSAVGSMAAIPLPDGTDRTEPPTDRDPLQDRLWESHRIEVPIIAWPHWPHRVIRISAQLYNDPSQYEQLGAALGAELA
jgi:isopenicillin-N epimerase